MDPRNATLRRKSANLRTAERIASDRVDRDAGEAGVIYGVSVIERGILVDSRGWEIDDETLTMTVSAINKRSMGVKSRYTHPDECHDGLGCEVGRVRDARLSDDGKRVLADVHLIEAARRSPEGNLADWLLDMAEHNPDLLELSISPDETFRLEEQRDEDGRRVRGEDGDPIPPKYRFDGLWGVDFVDKGAANTGGLFGDVSLAARAGRVLTATLDPRTTHSVSTDDLPRLLEALGPSLRGQVERRLRDERSRSRAARFLGQWLDRRSIDHTPITAATIASAMAPLTNEPPHQETTMNKRQLALLRTLGLADNASTEDALAFYNKLDEEQQDLVDHLAIEKPKAESKDASAGQAAAPAAKSDAAAATATSDPPTAPSAPTPAPELSVEDQVNAALNADSKRRSEIEALCTTFEQRGYDLNGLKDTMLNDRSCSLATAHSKIIDVVAKSEPTLGVSLVRDGADDFRSLAAAGLSAAMGGSGVYDFTQRRLIDDEPRAKKLREQAMANGLGHLSLQGLARECLSRAGVRGVHTMGGDQLFEQLSSVGGFGHSTSDFPLIVEAHAHKVLLAAYLAQNTTFEAWAREGSVNDFKTHKRIRLSESPLLKKRPEGAPAQHGFYNEEGEEIGADEWALAVGITRRLMINDDLSAFEQRLGEIGSAAKLTIEHYLWAENMLANSGAGPVMSDGNALYHADHGNVGTSALPSQTSLQAGIVAMAKQTGFGQDGSKIAIQNMPSMFLGSMSRVFEANQVIRAQQLDDTNRAPQHAQIQQISTIPVPHLTINDSTRWYLMPDKARSPMEVVYLRNQRMPRIKRVEGTTISGVQLIVEHDFGVGPVDWRTTFTNDGEES